jgi:hypothetical protein
MSHGALRFTDLILFCFKWKIKCGTVNRDSSRHFNFRLQESCVDVLGLRAFITTRQEELYKGFRLLHIPEEHVEDDEKEQEGSAK